MKEFANEFYRNSHFALPTSHFSTSGFAFRAMLVFRGLQAFRAFSGLATATQPGRLSLVKLVSKRLEHFLVWQTFLVARETAVMRRLAAGGPRMVLKR
jgi:hypothetical protein